MRFEYVTAAGVPIRAEMSPQAHAFFVRLERMVVDSKVSESDFIDVAYSKANPLLDATIFQSDRGAVTREVFESPAYAILVDMLARKHAQLVRRRPVLSVVASKPAAEHPLLVLVGNAAGVSVRFKPNLKIEDVRRVEHTIEGTIRGWRRIAILIETERMTRLYVIEPGDTPEEITFGRFYVRGHFTIVAKDNNPQRARAAFLAFEPGAAR